MNVNVEILAHISAPTTRQHDDQYRAQAEAYLMFEPQGVEAVEAQKVGNAPAESSSRTTWKGEVVRLPVTKSTPGSASETEEQFYHTPPSRPAGRLKETETLLEERQVSESYGSFPIGILSFEGGGQQKSGTNFSQTSIHGTVLDPVNSTNTAEPLAAKCRQQRIPEAIGPANQATVDNMSMLSELVLSGHCFSTSSQNGFPDLLLQDTQIAFTALETQLVDPYSSSELDGHNSHLSLRGPEHPHVLLRPGRPSPESNLPTEDYQGNASISVDFNHLGPDNMKEVKFQTFIAEDEVLRFVSITTSEDDSSPMREVQVSIGMGTTWSRSKEAPEPRLERQEVSPKNSLVSVRPSTENQSTRKTPFKHQNTLGTTYDFGSLPLEAIPPAPEVSATTSATWPSQITPRLDSMVSADGNVGHYEPKKLMRHIDMEERGFWRIETASWPRKIQYKFWTTLAELIQKGDFGWGITMHRESPVTDNGTTDNNELGLVRLYCWGELVEHTYLFLWLCSAGKAAGVQWIDADNLIVVQMP